MNRHSHKIAGALLASGLVFGAAAAVAPSAGATGVSLHLLQTTTSASASQPGAQAVVTATVDLFGLKGALITPSGSVDFTYINWNTGTSADLGTATLSRCLLGLPSILGLYDATCTATLSNPGVTAALDEFCTSIPITATYTAATDLVAESSSGNTAFEDPSCNS